MCDGRRRMGVLNNDCTRQNACVRGEATGGEGGDS